MKSILKTILKVYASLLFILLLVFLTIAIPSTAWLIIDIKILAPERARVEKEAVIQLDALKKEKICKNVGTGIANYNGEASCQADAMFFCDNGKVEELLRREE